MRTFAETESGIDAGEVLQNTTGSTQNTDELRSRTQQKIYNPGGNGKSTTLTTAAVVAALDAITLYPQSHNHNEISINGSTMKAQRSSQEIMKRASGFVVGVGRIPDSEDAFRASAAMAD